MRRDFEYQLKQLIKLSEATHVKFLPVEKFNVSKFYCAKKFMQIFVDNSMHWRKLSSGETFLIYGMTLLVKLAKIVLW